MRGVLPESSHHTHSCASLAPAFASLQSFVRLQVRVA